jgi:hypothetical protein
MNDTYILYDERDKIRTKPPDAELWVVGKAFWTCCNYGQDEDREIGYDLLDWWFISNQWMEDTGPKMAEKIWQSNVFFNKQDGKKAL